jgi:hypothetical protein
MKHRPIFCFVVLVVLSAISGSADDPKQPAIQRANQQVSQQKQSQKNPVKTETFWQKVLRITGISSTPSSMKGDEEELAGDLWITDLKTRTSRRITRNGGYRSPIFLAGDKTVLAIRREDVIEIPVDGVEGKKLPTIKGILKLVGLSAENADQVLFLSEAEKGQTSVGLLSLSTGQVTVLPYDKNSEEDGKMLEHILAWERVYDSGKISVYTKTDTKEGLAGTIEWSDVYLKRAGQEPVNVSKCDGANCGQPSLSPNGRYVVYIKAQ